MNEKHFITGKILKDGNGYSLTVPYGITALDAIRQTGLLLEAPCGGNGTCGKCRAHIVGEISAMAEREASFLSEEERKNGIRLACMCRLYGDFEMDITSGNIRVQTDFQKNVYTFSPMLKGDWKTTESLLGLAVDIGTTTVALYLCDLKNGNILASRGFRNPQMTYGADVISRIDKIMKNKNALLIQQKLLADAISQTASQMCESLELSDENIVSAVFCGNTVMQHIAADIDPSSIANAPFIAPTLFGEDYDGYPLGFLKNPKASVYFAPCFASYVGGDIACGMIASGLDACRERVLYIDIGTNGEIGLSTEKGLYFCSAAAGPALEGAHIACGMPGVTGAVSRVTCHHSSLAYATVDDGDAIGICGSGIIDAVAVMLELRILDETGYIDDEADSPYLAQDEDGNAVFMLDKERNIYICGRDIREIQLAKAAICAGIRTLLHEAGVSYESLSRIVIAGGFGSHLQAQSICRIGLIPMTDPQKISFVGNAAGAGAVSVLLGKEPRESIRTICSRSTYIELSQNAYFMEKYIEEMMFQTEE